ncbi:hypothetical protein ABEB36_008063 [Hypothenemus hampei]|uniref:Ionotropic receptor n=1 Tax=Hypothenemus hampei TaxID=57062 RepID=A0ABD1EL48_HYPHA
MFVEISFQFFFICILYISPIKLQTDVLGFLNNNIRGSRTLVILENNYDYNLNSFNRPIVLSNEHYLKQMLENLSEKPNSYHIISNESSLENILDIIKQSSAFQQANYVIFVGHDADVDSVANILWNFRLPDSAIARLYSNETFSVNILNCGTHAKAKPFKNFKSSPFNYKKMFRECPINILWCNYPPFVYGANYTVSGSRGIFFDFLEPLKKLSGRPIKILNDDDIDYHNEINEAFSFYSVKEDLQEESIFLGPIEFSFLVSTFDVTTILFDDDLVIVVPKSLVNEWNLLMKPMVLLYGLMILFILCLLGLVTFALNQLKLTNVDKTLVSTLYTTAKVFITNDDISLLSKNWLMKFFICFLILVFTVISFYVQASIFKSLTGSIYGPPITDIDSLLKSGRLIKITEVIRLGLEFKMLQDNSGKILDHSITMEQIEFTSALDEVLKERKYATFTVKVLLLMRPNYQEAFSYFPQKKINLSFAMKKNGFSSPYFSNWIGTLLESGFFEKWKNLHLFNLALKHSVESMKTSFVIDLMKFLPVMKLLLYCYVISITTFIIELTYFICKKNILLFHNKTQGSLIRQH